MQRYINQVLSDLEVATSNAPEVSAFRFVPRFMDDDDENEPIIQTKYTRLCDLFGIGADIFPPVERLTRSQVTALLTAFEKLWTAWNISWASPLTLTARRVYTVMVEKMNTGFINYNFESGVKIDFCEDRKLGKCPFADIGECHCKVLDEIEKQEKESFSKQRVHTDWFNGSMEEDGEENNNFVAEINADGLLALHRWFFGDDDDVFDPWDTDESEEKWSEFVDFEEESVSWLYFFQPQIEDEYEDEDAMSPEDFEDFEWRNSNSIEDYDLPF
jgi:hypothetical protein